MKLTYRPQGVCTKIINIDLDGDVIHSVEFLGGCPGNTLGISALVKGHKAEEVVEALKGIRCGGKGTSCPDQLAKALESALKK